jgi:two-component system response regulator HydG
VDVAVQAMKEGAFDFITKPFNLDTLLKTVQNALDHERLVHKGFPVTEGEITLHYDTIVGDSEAIKNVYALIERVAKTDVAVLIEGESGTGKELVAQAIHKCSNRSQGPWIPLNCAALSASLLESEMFGHTAGAFTGATKTRDGLFMAADKGTLFLDEIGAMDIGIQGKFLRALQEKRIRRVGDNKDIPVDVRIVAATNEDLERKMKNGEFREDLFYRISVVPVKLPPLRSRTQDIPLLAQFFVRAQAEALGTEVRIAPEAMGALVRYSWPGNVRELQNAIACAATLCQDGVITEPDLPPNLRNTLQGNPQGAEANRDEGAGNAGGQSLREFLKAKEQEYLSKILEKTDGNHSKAAERLGISRATLYRKLPNRDEE